MEFRYSLGFHLINVLMISLTLKNEEKKPSRHKKRILSEISQMRTKDTTNRIFMNATLPLGYI